jgi:hypothetical protein
MPKLTRIDEIGKDGYQPWAIDGIVSGVTVLWGKPACGKSFVAMGMVCSVASGRPWMGRHTEQGQVVYIAGEGGLTSVGHRLRTALAEWGVDHVSGDFDAQDVDLSVITPGIDLVANASELYTLLDPFTNLKLLVIDTLSRCMLGDENKQEDMGKFVAAVDFAREKYGCDVLIIHHANKQNEIRGSSVLFGAADVSWHLTELPQGRGDDCTHVMMADKLRERDAAGGQIKIALHKLPIIGYGGEPVYDELGSRQTTLVARPTTTTMEQVAKAAQFGSDLIAYGGATTYEQWFTAATMDKVNFDNALSFILSYPGNWGITRGLTVGSYVKAVAGEPDIRWR